MSLRGIWNSKSCSQVPCYSKCPSYTSNHRDNSCSQTCWVRGKKSANVWPISVAVPHMSHGHGANLSRIYTLSFQISTSNIFAFNPRRMSAAEDQWHRSKTLPSAKSSLGGRHGFQKDLSEQNMFFHHCLIKQNSSGPLRKLSILNTSLFVDKGSVCGCVSAEKTQLW